MTLEDLMETCGHISLLKATVRGDSKNDSILVSEYRVGARAEIYPSEHGVCPEWVHIVKKPIHVQDNGAESYQFGQVMKNVPKEIRQLEVRIWRVSREYGVKFEGYEMYVDLQSDEVARLMAKQKAREERKADKGDQARMEGF